MSKQGFAQHLFKVEKRRSERDEVCFVSRIRLLGGSTIPAEVLNVSRYGFMARADAILPQDSIVHIDLPVTGELKARIVWGLGNRVGAEFLSPIDAMAYQMMLCELPRGI